MKILQNKHSIELRFGSDLTVEIVNSQKENEVLLLFKELVNSSQYKKNSNVLHGQYRKFFQLSKFLGCIENRFVNERLVINIEGYPSSIYYFAKNLMWFGCKNEYEISMVFTDNTQEILESYMSKFVESLFNFKLVTHPEKPDMKIANLKLSQNIQSENPEIFSLTHDNANEALQKIRRGFEGKELKIDFVIPTKNVSLTDLSLCLNSIFPQMHIEDMIYVVDDNEKSKKLDRNWLKKYYPNVKIINGSQNGVAAARNLGVKAGKNELISFIDSDDYINESFVEIQRRFHRNFTSVAATGTWIQAFGKDSTIYPQWDNWPILGMLYCLPPAGVLMWKRKTLQSLGFFDEFFKSGFEDYDLTARCSAKKVPIVVLDKVMYMYRRGQESLSQSWTPEMETNLYLEVQSRNIKFLDTTELRIYLKNLKRIGQRLPKWPVDLNSPKIVYNDYTFLFDILLNKYRRNRQVRNGYNSLWTQVKYIMLESFHLFTMVIDYLYYRKKWTIFKGLYSDQSKVVKTAKP